MNIISDKITQVLGEYVQNFNPDHMKLNLLSGYIELDDLQIKTKKINDILGDKSPFVFKAGIVEKISL